MNKPLCQRFEVEEENLHADNILEHPQQNLARAFSEGVSIAKCVGQNFSFANVKLFGEPVANSNCGGSGLPQSCSSRWNAPLTE